MPEFGYYDPVSLILTGEKGQTLRKRRCHGRKEITVRIDGKQQRTGIIIEFTKHEQLWLSEFITEEFALADGIRATENHSAANNLFGLLTYFYNAPSDRMWCNHFRVVQRPEEEPK